MSRPEEEDVKLKFVKLSKNAFSPQRMTLGSAGFDLQSAYNYVVPARGKALIKTDIQIQLPRNTYGRIAPRSGLASIHHIDIGGGVIDEDYTGNITVIIFNHGEKEFTVHRESFRV